MTSTPVLLLVFNRPGATAQVLESIRQAKPRRLFIAADGPRTHKPDDAVKCRQVREIVSQVDWACEVKTLFREENLGCKRAVSSAIDWFFAQVEEGIILEDDCLPDQSFFRFCAELLAKYRDDERIMMISGNNVLREWDSGYSYHFSKIGAIWGWATWKRAWKHYDVDMKLWPEAKRTNLLRHIFRDENQAAYRELVCERTFRGQVDTWDYQWTFARLSQGGLSIVSSVNLITNIGFGADATHTTSVDAGTNNLPRYAVQFPLADPCFIRPGEEFDNQVFYQTINYRIPKRTFRQFAANLIK